MTIIKGASRWSVWHVGTDKNNIRIGRVLRLSKQYWCSYTLRERERRYIYKAICAYMPYSTRRTFNNINKNFRFFRSFVAALIKQMFLWASSAHYYYLLICILCSKLSLFSILLAGGRALFGLRTDIIIWRKKETTATITKLQRKKTHVWLINIIAAPT